MSKNESSANLGRTITKSWLDASEHVMNSFFEVNRASLAAFGFSTETNGSHSPEQPQQSTETWTFDRSVEDPDDISLGDTVEFTKTLTDADVEAFARASGDTNPLHLDDGFAMETRFGERIVHGTLVSGLISAALARLPGLTIYLSQDISFMKPVTPGQTLTAVVEVIDVLNDDRYTLSTVVYDEDGQSVVEGESTVLIDTLPEKTTESK
ncbi:MaoC family dehydratase [Haladaptatus caseinilyticus]|uniref:MaoC family dehydratase n=1 Tax=Haladaptatus caseinilyticus TaxID=2993314 RepID=UPI00224B2558|nr:MaoC family dehydratase [Haladaptatus caseinilyticus]